MTRQQVRSLKRALQASTRRDATADERALGCDSAESLLARSIRFGHRRLAVVRLAIAVNSGARVAPEQWVYCARVADASHDERLRGIYLEAAKAASRAR